MQPTITIGIPTYKRPRQLARLLGQLVDSKKLCPWLQVLVLDDSGDQGAHAVFHQYCQDSQFARLVSNPENQGYPRSLIRLIEECRSDYLLLLADDDHIQLASLDGLRDFLESETPDFISTPWLRRTGAGNRYRLASDRNRTGELHPRYAMQAAGHAPGLIMRTGAVLPYLPILRDRLISGCTIAATYPQVILLCELLITGARCVHFTKPLVQEGDRCTSEIRDPDGGHYTSLPSRIQQMASMDRYLMDKPSGDVQEELLLGARENLLRKVLRAAPDLRVRGLLNAGLKSFSRRIFSS